MSEEKQLHPQWAIDEAIFHGVFPTGYKIRSADEGRDLIKGMVQVTIWDVGHRVWIGTQDKDNYNLRIENGITPSNAVYVLPNKRFC